MRVCVLERRTGHAALVRGTPARAPVWQPWYSLIVGCLLLLTCTATPAAAAPAPPPETAGPVQASASLRPDATFTRITTEQGLSDLRIEAILQDSAGFIWFGTSNGLNRYDGTTIVAYRNDPANPRSLSGNFITDLHEDRAGTIWVGTRSGLNAFDRRTEQFTRYRHRPDDPRSLSNNLVQSIYEDRSGVLWLGTLDGLNRFDRASGTFTHYRHDPANPRSISNNGVRKIDEDQSGALWIGTLGGLNRFDRASGTFTHYRHDPANPRSLSHDVIWDIYRDRSGILWVGTDGGGLDRYDPASDSFIHYRHSPADPASLSDDRIDCIFEDSSGALWVGTFPGGLSVLDPARRTFTVSRYDQARPAGLSSNTVTDIIEDRSGLIWIGTAGGAHLYNPRQQAFTIYRHDPQDANTLASNSVSAVYEDAEGVLWIGTRDRGLDRFDRRTAQVVHYPPDPDNPHGLGHPYVASIAQDRAGALWIGTYGGGLYRLDLPSGGFTAYRHDPANPRSISSDSIGSIHIDRTGIVWVATVYNGLNRLDPQTGDVTVYRHNPNDPNSLSVDATWSLAEDAQGMIWIGTLGGGLNRLDPATGQVTRYRHDPNDLASLSDDNVYDLHIDRSGVLWVGTYGGGLHRFEPASGSFTQYREHDGLASDRVLSILEDNDAGAAAAGNLWITTSRGLSKLDRDRKTLHTYDTADGLPLTDYDYGHTRTRGGELLIASFAGLIAFDPAQVKDDPYVPPVVFTDFLLENAPVPVGETSVLRQTIDHLDTLELTYADRVIAFEFAALSYRAPQQNRYRYRLEGFDQGWIEVDARRRLVTYTNLDPGSYVFHVTGSNGDGVWNEAGRAIRIVIAPPWWETFWFRALAIALAVGVGFGAYQLRVRGIRLRTGELEQQVAERTQALTRTNEQLVAAKEQAEAADRAKSEFLATMSHELRTPLHTIMGYNRLMLSSPVLPLIHREHTRVVERSADHLTMLINNVLELAKIEAGHIPLSPTSVNLSRMLNGLAEMFRLQAERNGLRLRYLVDPNLPTSVVVDTVKLRQVLINLLGNAVKFTQAGAITLTVRGAIPLEPPVATPGQAAPDVLLIFEVADTGPGLTPEEQRQIFEAFVQANAGRHLGIGTGLGLTISRHFVRLMDGTIRVQSTLGHGTVFEVCIPAQIARVGAVQHEAAPVRSLTLAPGEPSYRMLVVDDHDDNRRLLIALLETVGLTVRGARDGDEAIAIALVWRPDLIFLDLRLPRRSGLDVARDICESAPDVPPAIVAVSASAFESDRAAALAAGCSGFIRKPFQDTEIIAALRQHLGVRFVEDSAVAPSAPGFAPASALDPADLAVLSDDMLALLEQASVEGQPQHIAAVIGQIQQHAPLLAERLHALAAQIAFDTILEAVRAAQQTRKAYGVF